MTTEELEAILEAATETPRIEFKRSCPWDVKKLAKDILAFSNIRDGGYLVIGVENDGIRTGVTTQDKSTYVIDTIKDQIAAYAEPHANLTLTFTKDRNDVEYVVIRVHEFRDVPVICKKDSNDTTAGVIYYRNTNKKPESAAVSNSYDMRDIIELATVKMMQRKSSLGFSVSGNNQFDKELNGL